MKESSFEKFNYALRPAKNIERKMLCEAFGRLSRIGPLSSYRYIGFGAVGFYDFCLFHQRLGINDMVSIEGYVAAQERITHNIPYSCIQMKWGMSHEVLPQLEWTKRAILWLDYERPIDAQKLGDVSIAAANLSSGSVVVVTVPADPGEVEANEDVAEKRLLDLRSRVGRAHIPAGLTGKHLAKWGTAEASQQIIVNQIRKTLSDRNAPLVESERLEFLQLFNFHYADGTRMLSVGGLLLNPQDASSLSQTHFQDLDFYRPEKDAYLIESPLLTWREIKALDEMLPCSETNIPELAWIPESERKKYRRVYRYFPAFSEVEF